MIDWWLMIDDWWWWFDWLDYYLLMIHWFKKIIICFLCITVDSRRQKFRRLFESMIDWLIDLRIVEGAILSFSLIEPLVEESEIHSADRPGSCLTVIPHAPCYLVHGTCLLSLVSFHYCDYFCIRSVRRCLKVRITFYLLFRSLLDHR